MKVKPRSMRSEWNGRVPGRAIVLTAAVMVLFGPSLVGLVNVWSRQDDYSHGFFVIPIALYLAWTKREEIRRSSDRPNWVGVPLFLMGLTVYIVSFYVKFHTLAYLSMIVVLLGIVLSVYGIETTRLLLVPILFLLFMFPIPTAYYVQITNPLKLMITEVSVQVLRLMGIPAFQEGNLLYLPTMELEVTEACSGIRSLYAYVMLGCLFAMLSHGWSAKVRLLALTVPIAFLINVVRVTGTGVLSNYFGPEMAQGFFHELTGFAAFFVGFAFLCAVYLVIHGREG